MEECTFEDVFSTAVQKRMESHVFVRKYCSCVSFLCGRCCLLDIHVIQTKDIIVACKNMLYSHTNVEEHEQLSLHLQTLTEAFRFLRNCCAETANNQNIIL